MRCCVSLTFAFLGHWGSLSINFASGCASALLHSRPGKNASARDDISFKWSQWKVLMISRDLSHHLRKLVSTGRSANDVPTSFPSSKSANRWRLHVWRNILRELTLCKINDSLRIYEQTFDYAWEINSMQMQLHEKTRNFDREKIYKIVFRLYKTNFIIRNETW